MDHLLNLIFRAISELALSKGVLYPSNLPYTYHHIFLRRRLTHGSTVFKARLWAKRSSVVVLTQFLFNLLETGHHL